MRISKTVFLALGATAAATSHPQRRDERDRAQAVKDAFTFAWNGYYSTCKNDSGLYDELHPVAGDCGNSRNGWGASAVDALSTAAIMGMSSVVDAILDHIANTDFSNAPTSNDDISIFETSIRYLAGMMSGYDLLNKDGPFYGYASNYDHVLLLQNKSLTLAEGLRIGYETKTQILDNGLNLEDRTHHEDATNSLAGAALQMEFVRLADMWNDPTYKSAAEAVQPYLSNRTEFPIGKGMVGSTIEIATGNIVGNTITTTWGPGSDSYYEYLLKYWIYDPSKTLYIDTWTAAVNTTIEKFKQSPNVNSSLVFLAEGKNSTISSASGHLNSFAGGNIILGGMMLNNSDYLDFGLQLADSCAALYYGTATGIGPEGFKWSTDGSGVPDDKSDFYSEHGFWISSNEYALRPEIIETWYYAFRATGDEKYRQFVWDAFQSIERYCKVNNGFSAINDVTNTDTSSDNYYEDMQESFFFAEVLKYTYMIFIDDAVYQVAKPGEETTYVFNTEAHPLKIKSKTNNGYTSS